MLVIKVAEDELKFFDDLRKKYPERVFVRTEHGFDMSTSTQIVINVGDILEIVIPAILAAIEMALLYRIQKKQTIVNEKEEMLHEQELELEKQKHLFEIAKAEREEFEVRLSSSGDTEILIKTSDIRSLQENPETLPQFIDALRNRMESRNGAV